MAQAVPARDACCVNTLTCHTIGGTSDAPDPHARRQTPDPRGRYVVHSAGGRIGVLKAVLSVPRLLLVDAPQVSGGDLLIPFDAIEQIRVDDRTILVRSVHEALDLAGDPPERRRDGG